MEISFEQAKENWGTKYYGALLKAVYGGDFHEYWKDCIQYNVKFGTMIASQQKRLDIRDVNDLIGDLRTQGLKLVGICLSAQLYDDLLISIKANGITNAQGIDFIYGLPVRVVQTIPDMVAVITE